MDQSVPDAAARPASSETLARVHELVGSGQLAEADTLCRQVLRAVPDDVDVLLPLAKFASEQGERQRALLLLEQAVGAGGGSAEIYGWLCHLYRLDGWIDEARAAGRAALQLPGVTANIPFNLALADLQSHDFEAARLNLLRSLALDTEYTPAHVELAHLLLRQGEFAPGWAEYAWIFRLDHLRDTIPKLDAPEWTGMRLPEGRVLLIGDQGYGDTIQFSRYIPLVRERVGDVVVGCSQELLPLISTARGVKECFTQWVDMHPFNAYCPLSFLPRIFETKFHSIPARVPYLKADPERVARWSARLTEAVGVRTLRVGIAWSGRPTHSDDSLRSLKWAQLQPLTRLNGVALISLQREIRERDRADFPGDSGAVDLSAEINDFADTAAIIENLDLVVSIDSSPAHLAGALAKPVWVMLPWLSDWRWLMDREDTPWYPTMRLFRQPARGDWATVIARVARGVEMAALAPRSRRAVEHKSAVAAKSDSRIKRVAVPVGPTSPGKQATGRWHVMDCSLRSAVGHHLNQCLAIAAELRQRKIPARFFVHAEASPDLLPGADVTPLFRSTVYDVLSNDLVHGEAEDFCALNRITTEDLARIDASFFDPHDIVLFPTATHNQLLGILQWAGTFDPASLPRIVVTLLLPPDRTLAAWQIKNPAKYFHDSWTSCPAAVRERVHLCAETEGIARAYEMVLGARPTVLPMPIAGYEMVPALREKQRTRHARTDAQISFLGDGRRYEKGLHLLLPVLRLCAGLGANVRFFVQADVQIEPGIVTVLDRLRAEPGVELHRGRLEPDLYYAALASSDLALLPYDPAHYRIQGSGIYFEAIVMGVPVIVPADTWMGREVLEHGNGITFTSFTPEGVTQAIVDALPQVDELRASAQRYATQLRPHRGIDAYVNRVLRLGIAEDECARVTLSPAAHPEHRQRRADDRPRVVS